MKKTFFKFLFLGVALSAQQLQATVSLNNLFSDNAVFQRGIEVPIWGWAAENEKVSVEFNGQKVETTATSGKWMVKLKPMKENATPQNLTVKGENTITVKNILIGEVWICSGQSNMEWALWKSEGGEAAVANSTNPNLRIFNVPHTVKMEPQSNVNAKWVLSDPKSTKTVSSIGYWFLSKLQKELGVPVGLVSVAFGGTVIESWLSKEVLEAQPKKDKYMDVVAMKAEYDANALKVKPIRDAWERAKDSAKINKLPAPPQPAGLPSEFKGTTTIYNGEIAPLYPYAVKGIAWYQGESNAYVGRANSYNQLLPVLVQSWRKDWGRADLPFLIFQITPNRKPQTDPNELSGIALVQEAQLKASLQIPNTALVITMDAADTDVHYLKKEPIADRALNAAMVLAYGKKAEYCGPIFKSMKIEGSKAIIEFTHLGKGLEVKGDKLEGFVICGADKNFVFADAKIDGKRIIISSDKVTAPVAVRYGWADYPKVNLFNKEGIPASPFRTDDWAIAK